MPDQISSPMTGQNATATTPDQPQHRWYLPGQPIPRALGYLCAAIAIFGIGVVIMLLIYIAMLLIPSTHASVRPDASVHGLPSQDSSHHHTTSENDAATPTQETLGTVNFSVSCSPEVQKPFERAVALMHSFQYTQARHGFEAVAQKDPRCAMAYWGEAMSMYHQLWGHPNAAELKIGYNELKHAQKLNPPTEREKLFIKGGAAYYVKNKKLSDDQRAQKYSGAMSILYEKYPEDPEAATFYALSLLTYDPPNEKDYANRREAIAILDKVVAANPQHPGASHYLIHAADRPALAPLGLQAALHYAQIAPSSPHALHMPSHIFSRLGMWQQSIDSNLAAVAAAESELKVRPGESHYELHPMDYLEYAYLQTGRDKDAWQVIENVDTVPGVSARDRGLYGASFLARYFLERHDWKGAASMELRPGLKSENMKPLPGMKSYEGEETFWARAIGAARIGDATAARKAFEQYKASREAEAKEYKYTNDRKLPVDGQEIAAWADYAEGKKDQAIGELRAAAEHEEAEAPENGAMPAREMLADMLLDMNRPADALAEYEKSLKISPNRFDGLYGAGHAAELAGKPEEETRYYTQLLKICGDAAGSSDRPELTRARTFLASQQPSPSPGH